MIEIRCDGGQIGRFCWTNSSESGIFYQGRQPDTVLRPGRWWWDHAWPDQHAWPVMPWGPGDPKDGWYRDYIAFEKWFADECKRHVINLDIPIGDELGDKLSLYAMFSSVFHAGVAAGHDPQRWAAELWRRQRVEKEG